MATTASKKFDILDVNLAIPMGVAIDAHLGNLRASLSDHFELKALESTREKMLRAHIICVGTEFPSIAELEQAIRQLAGVEDFPWQRFGGVPVCETATVQF
ncbi:hypothetical protein AB595_10220 [Massilia sp. WF1]|uniref:hypothetical protein n=1 Tax=unclassified Massilia TaxID=2609279 RepID=UPI00064B4B80|nr:MULTISPECIES: hypothetical protein [unclassified Massilia]ALK99958.1 hypothetical protein AM586_27315 [Massilia sp. WG5]KLU36800.1 hypothetical protein AB595_10220 [Massilia sp. WF1]